MLTLWFWHAGPGFATLFCAIALGYRVQWRLWEPLAFVLPFLIWSVAVTNDGVGKSLANLFVEPVVIGLAIPLAVVLRIWSRNRNPQWRGVALGTMRNKFGRLLPYAIIAGVGDWPWLYNGARRVYLRERSRMVNKACSISTRDGLSLTSWALCGFAWR
jgi:hypothetical protein